MKFTIKREQLLKPLQSACGVVERRQTLPILSNLLLNTESGGLEILGTDLEVEIRVALELAETESGKTTVSARKLLDICRSLPEDALIDFKQDKDKVFVKSGRSRFTLATLPATEFPNTEDVTSEYKFSISRELLKELIDRTHFAMAQQDVRYYLNGLLLEISEGKIIAVATDGHRLALYESSEDINISEIQQIIVPRKAIIELSRLIESSDQRVNIELGANHIRLTFDNISFMSKLIDGRFPDYQRVLPQGGDKIIAVDRDTLKNALNRASILTNEKFRSLKLQLSENTLTLLANNPEQEEAEEQLTIEYSGDPLEVGFNVNYILDALSGISEDQVQMTFSDADSCCLVHGVGNEHCKYVIMPMRL